VPARTARVATRISPAGEARLAGLPGIGPKVAEKFAARGLLTLQDLWLHLPAKYEDRTRITPIRALQPGVAAQVEGRVEAVERGFRWRPTLRVAIGDDSRATLVLRFFHFNRAQAQGFLPGRRIRCYGEPRPGQNGLEMVHPSYRFLADDDDGALREGLDPVYPAIEGIGAQTLCKLIEVALRQLPPAEELELLPPALLRGLDLPPLREALLTAHRPPLGTGIESLRDGTHPAIRRLALEEMLAHHLSLRRQRIALQAHGAQPVPADGALAPKLRACLPYALTGAQQRVLAEIAADMAKPAPMLRLVEGDVGSGKTVVAALAALQAIAAGRQVALMAPTELLAEQHLASFRAWLEPLGVRVAWLAGKVGGRARAAVLAEIAEGRAAMVVGTHALMQAGVAFADLALAVIAAPHVTRCSKRRPA
jgi:ATP-dependent DNA helicase RecG